MHRSALFTGDSGGTAAALLLYTARTRQADGRRREVFSLNTDFGSFAKLAVNCTRCKQLHGRRQGLHGNCTRPLFVKMRCRQHGAKKGGGKKTKQKQVNGTKS